MSLNSETRYSLKTKSLTGLIDIQVNVGLAARLCASLL